MLPWFYFLTYFVTLVNFVFHGFAILSKWNKHSCTMIGVRECLSDETSKSFLIRLTLFTLYVTYFTKGYTMRSIFTFQVLSIFLVSIAYVMKERYLYTMYMLSFFHGVVMYNINFLLISFMGMNGSILDRSFLEWIEIFSSVIIGVVYFFLLGDNDYIPSSIIQHGRRKKAIKQKKRENKDDILLNVVE